MEHIHHLTDPASRVSRNIRIRARRLVRSGGVIGMDIDDVEQELRLDLLARTPNYDPARASFETFADRVIANRVASLSCRTAARQAERNMLSLEAPAAGDDKEGLCLHEVLEGGGCSQTGEAIFPDDDPGLQLDLARLLAALGPALRTVALAVSQLSIADTARLLGLHRSTVYERLRTIRAVADDLGLAEYLTFDPTLPRVRR